MLVSYFCAMSIRHVVLGCALPSSANDCGMLVHLAQWHSLVNAGYKTHTAVTGPICVVSDENNLYVKKVVEHCGRPKAITIQYLDCAWLIGIFKSKTVWQFGGMDPWNFVEFLRGRIGVLTRDVFLDELPIHRALLYADKKSFTLPMMPGVFREIVANYDSICLYVVQTRGPVQRNQWEQGKVENEMLSDKTIRGMCELAAIACDVGKYAVLS